MTITAGVDVGSTYTKALLVTDRNEILGRALRHTGFRLGEVSQKTLHDALDDAGLQGGRSGWDREAAGLPSCLLGHEVSP